MNFCDLLITDKTLNFQSWIPVCFILLEVQNIYWKTGSVFTWLVVRFWFPTFIASMSSRCRLLIVSMPIGMTLIISLSLVSGCHLCVTNWKLKVDRARCGVKVACILRAMSLELYKMPEIWKWKRLKDRWLVEHRVIIDPWSFAFLARRLYHRCENSTIIQDKRDHDLCFHTFSWCAVFSAFLCPHFGFFIKLRY